MCFIYGLLEALMLQGLLLVPAHRNLLKSNFPLFITLLIAHTLITTPLGHPISRLKRGRDMVNEASVYAPLPEVVPDPFQKDAGQKMIALIVNSKQIQSALGKCKNPSWIHNNYNKGATTMTAPGWQGFGPVSFTAGSLVPRTVPGTQ